MAEYCDHVREQGSSIDFWTAQQRLIEEHLALAGHGDDAAGPVFRPVKSNVAGELNRPLDPNSVYRDIGPAGGAVRVEGQL